MPLTIRRRLVDRVRQWRKLVYAVSAGLVVLAGAIVFLSVSSPASSVEVVPGPTFFDPNRAFRWAEDMNRLYPSRYIDSQDSQDVVNWFIEKLPDPEDMPIIDEFEAPMGTGTVTMRNVAVVISGTSREAILIAAPRDIPSSIKIEPLAYTSGTATLLELIQVFSQRLTPQKTLIFLSTEDGSTGGLGIDHFLDTSDYADDVSVILTLHQLGRERTKVLSAGVTSPQSTTPGWFVQVVGDVLATAGLEIRLPGLMSQSADHALSVAKGDQVAGLTRGIASLRLYDEGTSSPSAPGMGKQGAALERLILSLETGTEIPSDPGTALLLGSGRYLTTRSITLLAVLIILPTFAAFFIWFFSSRISIRAALMHLRNLLSFAIPVGFMFLLAYILARAGLIPLYRFQVPTSAGGGTQPKLTATLILVFAGLFTLVLSRRFLGYFRPAESRAATEMARLYTGFFGVLFGLILMLARSPFLLLPCLTAAWAWPLATCFAEPVYSGALWRHRLTSNALVLLAGLTAPFALYVYVAEAHGVGWLRTWWFLLVQTVSGAYGALGPLALVFIAAGFAELAGVKRMRVVPIETLEYTDELSLLELPVPRSRRKPQNSSRPPLSPWG